MINFTHAILCGGSGIELWLQSRTGFPKQLQCLTENQILFQHVAQRHSKLGITDIQVSPPLTVTGEDQRLLASEQLHKTRNEFGCAILEPVGRRTAPALTLAALSAMEGGEDPILVVTPADHTQANTAAFTTAMQQVTTALGMQIRWEATGVNEVCYGTNGTDSSLRAQRGNLGAISRHDIQSRDDVEVAIIRIDPRYFGPTEVETLFGDSSKDKVQLGWVPQITLDDLVHEIVSSDLADAKKHSLLKH
jgi:hypothetical protein